MAETEQQESIRVSVNGEPRQVRAGSSIAEMLGEIGIDAAKVAVERNLEIVPRSTFREVVAGAGDKFEIVHFVGGG